MSDLDSWIVFLHVAALLGFLLAHGASSAAAFRIRQERDPVRIAALLDLSAGVWPELRLPRAPRHHRDGGRSWGGGFWSRGWIWASIVVLVVMTVLMHIHPAASFSRTRKAAGLPYFEGWLSHEEGRTSFDR